MLYCFYCCILWYLFCFPHECYSHSFVKIASHNIFSFSFFGSVVDLLVYMGEQGLLPDHQMLHAVVRALAGTFLQCFLSDEFRFDELRFVIFCVGFVMSPHGTLRC